MNLSELFLLLLLETRLIRVFSETKQSRQTGEVDVFSEKIVAVRQV